MLEDTKIKRPKAISTPNHFLPLPLSLFIAAVLDPSLVALFPLPKSKATPLPQTKLYLQKELSYIYKKKIIYIVKIYVDFLISVTWISINGKYFWRNI